MIETEGDPCGIMNHIRIIILVDTLFRYQESCNVFSLIFQRGFILAKINILAYIVLYLIVIFLFIIQYKLNVGPLMRYQIYLILMEKIIIAEIMEIIILLMSNILDYIYVLQMIKDMMIDSNKKNIV